MLIHTTKEVLSEKWEINFHTSSQQNPKICTSSIKIYGIHATLLNYIVNGIHVTL